MNRINKEQLKKLYEAPEPTGKRAFFRGLELKPLNIGKILWMQCRYISWWEWILSFFVLGGTVILEFFYGKYVLGVILSVVPLFAVIGVSDSVRSVTWGMSELEMSARFSLKSIVLARMVVAGIVNAVLELLFAFLAGGDFGKNVLYLMVPFLISAYGSLILVRKIPGRDGVYACAAFGITVGIAASFSALQLSWLYQAQYTGFWLLAVCFLLCLTFVESKRNIRNLEEIVWN